MSGHSAGSSAGRSLATDLITIDRRRLTALIGRERETYADRHPRSRRAFGAAAGHLLGGVPMTWMRMWAGRLPALPGHARTAPG